MTTKQKKRWYHDSWEYEFRGKLVVGYFNIAVAVFSVIVVAFVSAIIVDARGSLRAQGAEFACATQQMDSRRFAFTDSVVCVPYPMRRDTTSIALETTR
jgi:hypothetical protein